MVNHTEQTGLAGTGAGGTVPGVPGLLHAIPAMGSLSKGVHYAQVHAHLGVEIGVDGFAAVETK